MPMWEASATASLSERDKDIIKAYTSRGGPPAPYEGATALSSSSDSQR